MSVVDQKRGCLNGPRRGRKAKEKYSIEGKLAFCDLKREAETVNEVKNMQILGEQPNSHDPKLEAVEQNRDSYFSFIESFLHLQEDDVDGSHSRENKDQSTGLIETKLLYMDEHDGILMEGMNDLFTQRNPEDVNRGTEAFQPIPESNLIGKEHMESIAGDSSYEMWLNETEKAYYNSGCGYETLLVGDSSEYRAQTESNLVLTSQAHKMKLLDLQLKENQRHVELRKNFSFDKACERQPYLNADMRANFGNSVVKSIISQKGSIQNSSTCTGDVVCRGVAEQLIFPLKNSIDIHCTGISSFNAEDPYEESIDERSLDLQHERQKHFVKGGPRRQWSPEEDRLLKQLVEKYGQQRWSHIANFLQCRKGKQCRERWLNHLRSNIKKDEWTEKEEELLISLHDKYENRWAEIAKHIPGRPENAIKNHWNATKRRRDLRNVKPKRTAHDSSDSLEMVQRSMVLRNYLQKHLTGDSMTVPGKEHRKPHTTSDVDSPQETVDSSATVSYHNENFPLDLSCAHEGNSSNVYAMPQESLTITKYRNTTLNKISEQSNRYEKSFTYSGGVLHSSSHTHLGKMCELSPFPNQDQVSLLDYGCRNVLASEIMSAESAPWRCGTSDLNCREGDQRQEYRWGQKLSNFVHSLESYGQALQTKQPFPPSHCCPPALVSCEEDVAVAFKGQTLSANFLQIGTHDRSTIKDWFASPPPCGDDFNLMPYAIDRNAHLQRTATLIGPVDEISNRFSASEHGQHQTALPAQKLDEKIDIPTLLEGQTKEKVVNDLQSSTGLEAYLSENSISVPPAGHNFVTVAPHEVSAADNSKPIYVVAESTPLPEYHLTENKEWIMESDTAMQLRMINKQELDLIEFVNLS